MKVHAMGKGLLSLILAVVFCSGCATRDPASSTAHGDMDWDVFMETLRSEHLAKQDAGDGPDTPVDPLPELPDASELAGVVTIQPDSVVQVAVQEDTQLNGSYTVNELSAIQLGYVGPVFLHNMTEEEAARKIQEVLENRFFNQATVAVRILQPSYDTVAVRGRVSRPGVLRIGSGDNISLNDALLRVGNVTAPIRDAHVRIVRGGLTRAVAASEPGELYALVDEEGKPRVPEVSLWNNDVAFLYVSRGATPDDPADLQEQAVREVLVLGEVRRQGIYRFSDEARATMLHLILQMGGFPTYADTREIRIIRQDEQGDEYEMTIDAKKLLKEGDPDLDVALEHGDRVIVPSRRMSLF